MEIINITPNISITGGIDIKSNTEIDAEQSVVDDVNSVIDNTQVSVGIEIKF